MRVRLAADEQVLLDRQAGEDAPALGHEGDAERYPPVGAARAPIGCRRRSAPRPARGRRRPATALSSVDLPAPLAPMIATRLALVDVQADAEQRLEVAVATTSTASISSRLTPSRPCQSSVAEVDVAHLRARRSRPRGSPSISLRPASTATIRSTTREQRVHDVLDPDDGDTLGAKLLDRLDQLEHLGLGQPAGDLVEQEHARLGRLAPARARGACARAASADRQARSPCRAGAPVRARRPRRAAGSRCLDRARRLRPRARSRTRSVPRTAAGSGRCGRCPTPAVLVTARACVMSRPSNMTRPRRAGGFRRRRSRASSCRPRSARRCRAPRPPRPRG